MRMYGKYPISWPTITNTMLNERKKSSNQKLQKRLTKLPRDPVFNKISRDVKSGMTTEQLKKKYLPLKEGWASKKSTKQ